MANVLFQNPVVNLDSIPRAVGFEAVCRTAVAESIVRKAFSSAPDAVFANLSKLIVAHTAGEDAVDALDGEKRGKGRPPKYSDAVREAQAAQIVKVVADRGECGFREVADQLGVEVSDLRPALKLALASGKLVQNGTKRGATYKVAA